MNLLKKNFRRILMLTGILIFALSISVFAGEYSEPTLYVDLTSMINKTPSGDTLVLADNIILSGDTYGAIVKDTNITIDLNGYDIKSEASNSTLKVEADASLKIIDTSGDGRVINNYKEWSESNKAYVYGEALRNYGTLEINGGTYESEIKDYSMYAIYITEDSITTINGGTFNGVIYTNGIKVNNCALLVNDGVFNSEFYLAGAGSYTIEGGKYTPATETIYSPITIKRGTLTINDGTFLYNTDSSLNDSANVGNNDSGTYRGVIVVSKTDGYVEEVTLNLNGGTITNEEGDAIVLANESEELVVNFVFNGTAIVNGNIESYISGDNEELVNITLTKGTLEENNAVAKVGTFNFNTLEEALEIAKDGDTIEILDNIELETGITIEGKNLTIDLGDNNTITAPFDVFSIRNANVTFTGKGTIEEGDEASYGAIIVRGSDDTSDTNYTTITVEEDVTLIGWAPICIRQNKANKCCGVTVNVYGTLTGKNDAAGGTGAGIYINGSIQDKENYPVINIYPGAKLSGTGLGIFAMGYANWNIEGASIEGVESGIGMKAGIWNISGDTVIMAIGENSAPTDGYSNGINASGAAIQIESNSGYAGNIEINIYSGEITSTNGYSIYEYLNTGDTQTTVKSINIIDGKFKGGILTSKELDDIKTETFKVSGGYFTEDPTNYLVEGKVAVTSTMPGYSYEVSEKNVDVDTTVKVEKPAVENETDVIIKTENFAADESTLKAAVATLANDSEVVGNSGDAVSKLEEALNQDVNSGDVTVVVMPYIDIELKSGDVTSSYLEFNISAKYNVIVTTNSGDIKLDGNDKNAVTIGSGDIKDISSIEITLALPKGFLVNSGDTLYVHHTKTETGLTYVYEAKVSGEGEFKTITFTNPNGFSKFEVKDTPGAAKIGTTVYGTLQNAVDAVKNNETITLLANCEDIATVNRVVEFTLALDGNIFSGDISAGSNVTRAVTGDSNLAYKFTVKETPRPSVGGGGSSVQSYRITVTQTEGGKISPKSTRVEEGENQTFTIKANEGYVISDVIVDAKSVGKVSEYTFEDVSESHAITAIFVKEGEEEEWLNPFKDVSEDDWYFEAVKYVSEKGLFNGMSADEFGPYVTLTRGMLVTILYRLEGSPVTNKSIPFADVDMSKYYANPIVWAKQNNIVNGIDETNFAPDAEITREQLATILYRYAKAKGMDVSVGEDTNILSYDDANEFSEYSIEAFEWACGAGIIKGRTESTIVPKGNAKRCEVATMFLRFIEE